MKKLIVLAILLTASTAQARLESSPVEMFSMKELKTESTKVNIIRTDNIPKTCEAESIKRGKGGFKGAPMEACSFYDFGLIGSTCTIVVGWKTNNDILGHELHHCFVGEFH